MLQKRVESRSQAGPGNLLHGDLRLRGSAWTVRVSLWFSQHSRTRTSQMLHDGFAQSNLTLKDSTKLAGYISSLAYTSV